MTDRSANGDEPSASQQRILDAAVDLFLDRGYSNSATSEIAKRAGVAEGTIFRYFRTKKDLLIGTVGPLVLRAVTPIIRERLEAALTSEFPSMEAFVRSLAADRLDFARSHPKLVRLLTQELPFHPELREQFSTSFVEAFYPMLLSALDRMRKRGLLRDAPASSAARMILSVIAGFVLTRLVLAPDAQWDDEAELDFMAQVLGRGLSPEDRELTKRRERVR